MPRELNISKMPMAILRGLLIFSVSVASSTEIQNSLTVDQIKTLNSIKQIDGYPLYTMS